LKHGNASLLDKGKFIDGSVEELGLNPGKVPPLGKREFIDGSGEEL
jgi:hypothetical protein